MSNLSTYVYCVPCMIFCCIIFYCLCVPCYNFARVSCRNVKPLPESGLLWVFRLLAESSDWESSTIFPYIVQLPVSWPHLLTILLCPLCETLRSQSVLSWASLCVPLCEPLSCLIIFLCPTECSSFWVKHCVLLYAVLLFNKLCPVLCIVSCLSCSVHLFLLCLHGMLCSAYPLVSYYFLLYFTISCRLLLLIQCLILCPVS